jgi:hypothetical protein
LKIFRRKELVVQVEGTQSSDRVQAEIRERLKLPERRKPVPIQNPREFRPPRRRSSVIA